MERRRKLGTFTCPAKGRIACAASPIRTTFPLLLTQESGRVSCKRQTWASVARERTVWMTGAQLS